MCELKHIEKLQNMETLKEFTKSVVVKFQKKTLSININIELEKESNVDRIYEKFKQGESLSIQELKILQENDML